MHEWLIRTFKGICVGREPSYLNECGVKAATQQVTTVCFGTGTESKQRSEQNGHESGVTIGSRKGLLSGKKYTHIDHLIPTMSVLSKYSTTVTRFDFPR